MIGITCRSSTDTGRAIARGLRQLHAEIGDLIARLERFDRRCTRTAGMPRNWPWRARQATMARPCRSRERWLADVGTMRPRWARFVEAVKR